MSSSIRRFSLVLSSLVACLLLNAPAFAQSVGINVMSAPYNAVGDSFADDTAALNAAYADAKAQQVPLIIPPGIFKFTSTLVWDGPVNVIGSSMGSPYTGTVLKKSGNFVAIKINQGAFGTVFSGFKVDSFGGESSNGIEIDTQGQTGWVLRDLLVRNQGGHGIVIRSGNMGMLSNVSCAANGGDGVRIESFTGVNPATSANAITFTSILVNSNGGAGFNIVAGDSHFIHGVVTQGNGTWGLQTEGLTSTINVYAEANSGGAVLLGTGSIRNNVTILNAQGIASIANNGRLNTILDLANGIVRMPFGINPGSPSVNQAGQNFSFAAGGAGPGAVGQQGGSMSIVGGDAAGSSGEANGGDVFLYGGNPVGGGRLGYVVLQPYGGQVIIGGQNISSAGAILDLQPNDGPKALLIPRLTTAQRDAIPTPKNGMIIFNETTQRFNFRRSSIWSDTP